MKPIDTSHKGLKISVVASTQLANFTENAMSNEIALTYKNEKISGLNFLKLRFQNTGNTPLLKNDFVKDLVLKLEEGKKIISVTSTPGNLLNISNYGDNNLELSTDLLNPGQVVDLDLFVINKDGLKSLPITANNLKVDHRIVNLNKVLIGDQSEFDLRSEAEKKKEARSIIFNFFKKIGLGVLIILLSVPFILFFKYTDKNKNANRVYKYINYLPTIFYFVIFGGGALLIIISLLSKIFKTIIDAM